MNWTTSGGIMPFEPAAWQIGVPSRKWDPDSSIRCCPTLGNDLIFWIGLCCWCRAKMVSSTRSAIFSSCHFSSFQNSSPTLCPISFEKVAENCTQFWRRVYLFDIAELSFDEWSTQSVAFFLLQITSAIWEFRFRYSSTLPSHYCITIYDSQTFPSHKTHIMKTTV
jgi:hypothetical protein